VVTLLRDTTFRVKSLKTGLIVSETAGLSSVSTRAPVDPWALLAVVVVADTTTVVTGNYVQRGSLQVTTSPAVPATIFVDGLPRDDWGMWTDLEAGSYQVCFGDVDGFTTPACEAAVLTAGVLTSITGVYTPSP